MRGKTREYASLDRLLEKIEVVSRLNPAVESDQELAFVLQTLMDVVADYAQRARAACQALMHDENQGENRP